MALKNAKRALTIETSLGQGAGDDADDPLLLLRVTGAEGISMPYAFELTMLGNKDSDIKPDQLIGRPASFGIRKTQIINTEQEPGHNERFGVFETFERLGTLRERRIFRGRFVPAFRMTAYEQRYRIFQDRDLVSILREVLQPFPLVDLRVNLLADMPNTPLPYCVQYNETTFAFVHRLLDRCGVAYRFEHGPTGQEPAGRMRRERMVLSFRDHRPNRVDDVMRLLNEESSADDSAKAMTGRVVDGIRAFRLGFQAAAQNARVGDFNPIDPTRPPEGLAVVDSGYAFSARSIGVRAEAFPAPGVDPKNPDDAARLRMRQNEVASASASGRVYSSSFYGGRVFLTSKDESGAGMDNKSFVLRLVTIDAFDVVDERGFFGKIFDLLKSAIFGGSDPQDLMGQGAEQLRDKLKGDIDKGTEIYKWLAKKEGATDPSGLPGFIADKIGRGGAGLFSIAAAAIPAIKEIAEIISKMFSGGQGFACAFEAVPTFAPFNPDHWPTPTSPRPVAYGPHFALVVGPKGVDTSQQDILTDALGRVRVRFPWDPGPPGKDEDTPAESPFATDKVTAFVKVSEGWAGSRFGTQFIPRIGQEVLVGFIDGDPEKPIVTGRIYNAGAGRTNLPYPSQGVANRQIEKLEDLPATQNDNTTRSGIRTRSTPNADTKAGFHAIRFDDLKGKEQLMIRGEHRIDTTSTGSRFDTTKGSRNTVIGGGKEQADGSSGGGDFISVGGERDLTIGDSRYTKVGGRSHHQTAASDKRVATGRMILSSEDELILDAPKIMLQASQKIQLVVGGSKIVITPASITTEAAMLDHKSAAADPVDMKEIFDPLGAAQADPGEPPDFLAQQKPGSGGRRPSRPITAHQAPLVTTMPDGRLRVAGSNGGGTLIDTGQPPDHAFADRTVAQIQAMRDDPATASAMEAAEQRKNALTFVQQPADVTQGGPVGFVHDPAAATQASQPTGRTGPDGTPEFGTGAGSPNAIAPGEPAADTPEAQAAHRAQVAQTMNAMAPDDAGQGEANAFAPAP